MPDRHSVRRWAVQYPDFRTQYEEARLLWADEIFEQIAERAGEACQVAEAAEQRGLNPQAAVGALREEIRGLQWVAARLRPDKYGDRIAAEVSGPGGAPLIPANRETRLPQLVAALAVLLPGTANAECSIWPARFSTGWPTPPHCRRRRMAMTAPVDLAAGCCNRRRPRLRRCCMPLTGRRRRSRRCRGRRPRR